ncbi:MAG TPA: LLM class F420-dependent oxidoreductase [Candidatus Limnocylindrales bacterium]|nr:LLM class F420-dependent oxidoreductase [Candidatus Limnocylindrales bacterium]
MKYGLNIFVTEYAMPAPELAVEAEARGFESLWFPEHTHIPASRATPFPGGGDLPQHYYDTFDPFVTLGACAAVTKKLRLATGIALVIQRDPIVLAKEVATLDRISNGRAILGIGGGWNVEEMANHGTDSKKRWKVLRERIEAMKAIWTNEKAEYHGEFVDFDPIFSNPKPVQKPHPPIVLGAHGAKGIERVVRYCDGWIPIGVFTNVEREMGTLAEAATAAGRDPKSIEVSVFGVAPDKDQLVSYRDSGVARAVFSLPSAPREKLLPMLDRYEALMKEVG